MSYVIIRLLFNIYLIGNGFSIGNALSCLLFAKWKIKRKTYYFLERLMFAVLWPIAIFSTPGRKKLYQSLNKL